MKKTLLMSTQKSQVLDAIQRQQFDASKFSWTEKTKERVPMVADEGVISVLVHISTDYSFSFDLRHEHFWATFSPGRESPEENKSCKSWPEMLALVKEWLFYLKRETDAALLLPPPSALKNIHARAPSTSIPEGLAFPKPPIKPMGRRVFIGHGRSKEWIELKDFLNDRLSLQWEEFNREPTAGLSTKERLEAMLEDACFAFLVMTAEKELPDGASYARLNVIHEAGLFQGKLGFERAIILLEEGCAEFSNIHGLTQIRFPHGNIRAVFEEVRRVLEREHII